MTDFGIGRGALGGSQGNRFLSQQVLEQVFPDPSGLFKRNCDAQSACFPVQ